LNETSFIKAIIINSSLENLIKNWRYKMKLWIIAGILAGLLIIAGIAVVNATADQEVEIESQQVEVIECSSCGNSCSTQRNCGQSTCGAVNGGSCGCGK